MPRPNHRSMPTQHIATLLGATSFVSLATVLRCAATRWILLAQVWKWSNLSEQYPTLQHGGLTYATCCAQQCCDMLHWHVAIVWPGLLATLLRLVATCCGMMGVVGPNLKMVKFFHVTLIDVAWCCSRLARSVQQCCGRACALVRFSTRNMSQQGGQTYAPCCIQQCCDMLRSNVAIVSPEL